MSRREFNDKRRVRRLVSLIPSRRRRSFSYTSPFIASSLSLCGRVVLRCLLQVQCCQAGPEKATKGAPRMLQKPSRPWPWERRISSTRAPRSDGAAHDCPALDAGSVWVG
ncbi:hypothetical protein MRX96_018539 [Rhipicephalus microplus]